MTIYPQTPTDYTTGLRNFYADDAEKRRRHGELLKEQGRQQVKKAESESLAKVLEPIAGLSKTLTSLSQSREAAKTKRDETKFLKTQQFLSSRSKEEKEAAIKLRREIVAESTDLKFEAAAFEKQLKTLKVNGELLDPAIQKKYITLLGGSQIVETQILGGMVLRGLDNTIENIEDSDLQTKLTTARDTGDSQTEKDIYKQIAYAEMRKLGISEDFIAAHFESSLETYINTKGVMSKLYYEKVYKSEQEAKWSGQIQTHQTAFYNGDESGLINGLHQHLNQAANKDQIVTLNSRLSRSGEGLTYSEIQAVKEGILDPKGQFKAGKFGKDLLSKEQWDRWEKSALEYSNKVIAQKKLKLENDLIAGETELGDMANDNTIKELTTYRDGLGAAYLSGGGSENDEQYKRIMSLDLTELTEDAYKKSKETLKDYYSGNLDGHLLFREDFINSLPNKKSSSDLSGRTTEIKNLLASAGIPITSDWHNNRAKVSILKSGGQNVNLDPDTELGDWGKALQYEIATRRLKRFIVLAESDEYKGNALGAWNRTKKEIKDELDLEGFGVKDDNENAGRLSPNFNGVYVNLGKSIADQDSARRASSLSFTDGNEKLWRTQTQNLASFPKGKYTLQEETNLLLKDNKWISDDLVLGAVMGDTNLTDGLQFNYSPELVTKSLQKSQSPSYVLLTRLENIMKDKNYAEFVERNSLKKKYEWIKENAPDLKLEKAIQAIGDKDLLAKWKTKNLTKSDIIKIIRLGKQND